MTFTARVCLLLLLTSAGFVQPARAADQRLNVVMFVVDDLCCHLGCYGADVKTPNIDRLAAKGVRFDRAYCQYPVCNPSRASLLTGQRPGTTGIIENTTPFRRTMPDVVTLPQFFRERGYRTVSLGKIIHQGIDDAGTPSPGQDPKSWDECRGFKDTELGRQGEGRNLTGGKIKILNWLAAEGTDEDQADGQLAAAAVEVLESVAQKPLFLAVGFHKPHDPFHAPKAYFDLYPEAAIKLHQPPADRTPDLPAAIPPKAAQRGYAPREAREMLRAYSACTTFMDAQVGKVLEALDRLKLWDNTVVLLIGDHGYHLGEHDWWSKFTLFEMGSRPPLVVWAPGNQGAGKPAAGIVEFVDIYPTLVDVCGLAVPAGLAGKSFRPLLEDASRPGKAAAFTQYNRGKIAGRTVRTDRWRYTEWNGGKDGVELYDHAADPLEYQNLAGKPDLAEIEKQLKALLQTGGKDQ